MIWIQCLLYIHSVQQRSTACCRMAGSQCSHSQQRHIRIFQSIFSCSMAPLLQLYIQYSIDTITLVFLCQNSTSTQSWSVSCHSHSVAHAFSEWPVTKSMDSTYSTKLYQGTDPRCMHALIELWTSSCTYSLCTVTSSPS